jgi:hypothetical protein
VPVIALGRVVEGAHLPWWDVEWQAEDADDAAGELLVYVLDAPGGVIALVVEPGGRRGATRPSPGVLSLYILFSLSVGFLPEARTDARPD